MASLAIYARILGELRLCCKPGRKLYSNLTHFVWWAHFYVFCITKYCVGVEFLFYTKFIFLNNKGQKYHDIFLIKNHQVRIALSLWHFTFILGLFPPTTL